MLPDGWDLVRVGDGGDQPHGVGCGSPGAPGASRCDINWTRPVQIRESVAAKHPPRLQLLLALGLAAAVFLRERTPEDPRTRSKGGGLDLAGRIAAGAPGLEASRTAFDWDVFGGGAARWRKQRSFLLLEPRWRRKRVRRLWCLHVGRGGLAPRDGRGWRGPDGRERSTSTCWRCAPGCWASDTRLGLH